MSESAPPSERGAMSLTVIEAIAAAKSTTPAELTPPLYEAIDPEALNVILQSGHGDSVTVTFEYQEFEVTVSDSGDVSVTPAENATAGSRADDPQTQTHD
ncbi:HalOD1 output domain-containing protein [Natrononativus amylolyticus]|uniref:HalOD1 output domain-containing protein n=1 Tax=Natrononativus amylolyticus TaxID=2963434 RepID=UPI0020CF09A2|nr:HalOD1 output domain-containing protein [Natrononativus amylolyticus]